MNRPAPAITARDVLAALGWSLAVGAGAALGIYLGSLGADVAVDGTLLLFSGAVFGAGALITRMTRLLWQMRPGRRPPGRPAARRS